MPTKSMQKKPESVLKTIFGYSEFRTHQRAAIDNVLAKKDTLVIMPTGGGKSLCYQIPALLLDGLTVVVSPLISLMKDQVFQLKELGVPAVVLNSSLSSREYTENVRQVENGEAKLLYVAPETLLQHRTLALLQRVTVDCLTVDEAHCISEWGHDFRPEYRQIASIRAKFPNAACLALTATATPRVRQDIQSSLNFGEKGSEYVASFNRENLLLRVARKHAPVEQLFDVLQRHQNESGIIYCFSRKQVNELAEILHQNDYSVLPYHAGLPAEERTETQEKFIRDDVQIIVATIAFGMGINKSNVRFVMHYDLPKNIESYYQEIGRAGRDGLEAECVLLFGYGDIQKIRYFFDEKPDREREIAERQLQALIDYAEYESCRRGPLLNYFGENHNTATCNMCDICLDGTPEQEDFTVQAQKFMSCMIRTGEQFGANHIVEVLRGSRNQRILQQGHTTLSTYDIGGELSKKQWLHLGRQLLKKGFIEHSNEFGSLAVTRKGRAVLNNLANFQTMMIADKKTNVVMTERAKDYDLELFAQLRQLRKQIADAKRVPPYVIFTDKSLAEMATFYPQTEAIFLKMNGVGSVKFEHYGAQFLGCIRAYCKARHIEEKQPIYQTVTNKTLKHHRIGRLFNEGMSVLQLSEREQVKLDTIATHLQKFIADGQALRPHDFREEFPILKQYWNQLIAAFDKHGTDKLRPVFDELEANVDWPFLKLFLLQQAMAQQV